MFIKSSVLHSANIFTWLKCESTYHLKIENSSLLKNLLNNNHRNILNKACYSNSAQFTIESLITVFFKCILHCN